MAKLMLQIAHVTLTSTKCFCEYNWIGLARLLKVFGWRLVGGSVWCWLLTFVVSQRGLGTRGPRRGCGPAPHRRGWRETVHKSSYAPAPSPPGAACWRDCASPGPRRSHSVCPPSRSSCTRLGHAVCTERVCRIVSSGRGTSSLTDVIRCATRARPARTRYSSNSRLRAAILGRRRNRSMHGRNRLNAIIGTR